MQSRVLMLAPSGAGKTTYMATMYQRLQRSAAGFQLRARSKTVHKELLDIAKGISGGQYPFATDQRRAYEFELRHAKSKVLDFDWIDIRGDTIQAKSSSAAVGQLVSDLHEADGIVVFCDALQVHRGNRRASQLGRMTMLLSKAFQGMRRNIPISVVLTKCDLINPNQCNTGAIDQLLDVIRRNSNIDGAMMFVACGPTATCVELPVLHAIREGVVKKLNRIAGTAQQQEAERRDLVSHTESFWGLLEDGLFSLLGKPSPTRGRLNRLDHDMDKTQMTLRKIQSSNDSLSQHLRSITVL